MRRLGRDSRSEFKTPGYLALKFTKDVAEPVLPLTWRVADPDPEVISSAAVKAGFWTIRGFVVSVVIVVHFFHHPLRHVGS